MSRWIVALIVVVVFVVLLFVWALCRAAALGDEQIGGDR